jgi:hypothetical protein
LWKGRLAFRRTLSGQEAELVVRLVIAMYPVIMSQSHEDIGDDAGNHLVDPRLEAGAGHDDAATLHPTPERRVAFEEQVRHDVRTVVVPVSPELKRLTPSDFIERIRELAFVTAAFLIEEDGFERVVWPVGIVLDDVVGHAWYEYHDMQMFFKRLVEGTSHMLAVDQSEGCFNCIPCSVGGHKLRGK